MAPMGQNPFCTNIVMLHIKSKVMKRRIQWCKNFAPRACLGVTRGEKVGFWVLFFDCHPTPFRLFLARTLKLSQVIALWKNAFGILMCWEICHGAGAGICLRLAPVFVVFLFFQLKRIDTFFYFFKEL